MHVLDQGHGGAQPRGVLEAAFPVAPGTPGGLPHQQLFTGRIVIGTQEHLGLVIGHQIEHIVPRKRRHQPAGETLAVVLALIIGQVLALAGRHRVHDIRCQGEFGTGAQIGDGRARDVGIDLPAQARLARRDRPRLNIGHQRAVARHGKRVVGRHAQQGSTLGPVDEPIPGGRLGPERHGTSHCILAAGWGGIGRDGAAVRGDRREG